MTQGPPPGNDNNETVALNRGDLPPGYGQPQGQQAPPQTYGQAPQAQPQQYGQAPPAQPQQQYGQPQGQPPYGSPPAATSGGGLGVAALVLAGIGVVAALVGMFALNWFRDIGTDAKFLDIKKGLDGSTGADWSKAYFGWAAFVLLAVAVIAAILAAVPSGASGAFRALGAVIGLAGAAYTILSPKFDGSDNYGEILKHGLGMYAVAGGFVLLAIGALVGSRRRV